MSMPLGFVLLAASLAAPNLKDPPAKDGWIVVFRHHPGIIAEKAVMKARDADAETLQEAARKACGGLSNEGGLGSGFELSLPASKLGRWKAAVDKLIKAGSLRHYDRWGLDHHGYGLVPIR